MSILADPPESAVQTIEQRAIEATLACIARHGLTKTTVDDIARQAGCARATLYRYFGGKQELVGATVAAETGRIARRLEAAAAGADTLEDTLMAVLTTAADELRTNEALQFVATHEPALLLPHLTFGGGDVFLAAAGTALEPCLAPYVEPHRLARAGEWAARVCLALLFSPTSPLSLGDIEHTRTYVREFVLPAIQPSVQQASVPGSPRG
ncbi:MAG: TetR/AcrR family transcriptional regulator [Acidimicrobiia bacterium]